MAFYSVIMPLYNKAPYVRKAVESVIRQTLTDWELVIVDDGSTDGSTTTINTMEDNRIRLISQSNSGASAARNRGVAESTAPYICFLDADDWWEPTFLEEMAKLIERYPDAGIYGTGYWIVKNSKKRLAPIGVDNDFKEGEINYCQVYARTLCMPLWTGAVCMPREIFDTTVGFPTNVKLGEDFLLWIHVALKYKVVLLNNPLSNYNQDVDITYRGTHHLHPPEKNMLWNLTDLEPLEQTNADYKQLIDNLRTYSLLAYLLDRRYRTVARKELEKLDWGKQPANIRQLYRLPIWILKIRQFVLKKGSLIKQSLIR